MGVLLFTLSLGLFMALAPVGLAVTFAYNFLRYNWRIACKKTNYDLLGIALVIDATGNVVCKDLFNLILITPDGYRFGNRKETISSCLGKNKLQCTLTPLGRWLDRRLNSVDQNHSVKSIDERV